MSAISSRRKRRAIATVALGVVSLAVLPTGLVVATNVMLHSTGGNNVTTDKSTKIPVTPTALLAVTDSRNALASLAMIAVAPGGKGGTIVSLPVNTSAVIAKGYSVHRFSDSFASSGLTGLQSDVEGTLGVTFDLVASVNATDLATLMTPMGTQNVNLAQPVYDNASSPTATSAGAPRAGAVTVLPAGAQSLTPTQVATALASDQTSVPESTRLPQVKALWSAVANATATASTSSGATATSLASVTSANTEIPTDAAGFFTDLFKGSIQVWQLSSSLITDTTVNPNNSDLYQLDTGETLMIMASVAPSAIAITSSNVTVLIDSPFADTNLVKEAVVRLAYVGATVVVVRQTADAPQEHTTVAYTDEMVHSSMTAFESVMGALSFNVDSTPVEGINARITLGNDFKAFITSPKGVTIATTTTVAG
jgi:hypothetical protein